MLTFRRYYFSHAGGRGSSLGASWRHEYSRTLEIRHLGPRTLAEVWRATGQRLWFEYDLSNDRWLADPDVRERLETLTGPDGTPAGWRLITPDNRREDYDRNGRLIRIQSLDGERIDIDYDSQQRPVRISHRDGRTLHLSYDDQGRLQQLQSPRGVFSYHYDVGGRLASVVLPDATPDDDSDNPRRAYYYLGAGSARLSGVTDMMTRGA